MKLSLYLRKLQNDCLAFWCQACHSHHQVYYGPRHNGTLAWEWDHDVKKPTLSPSVLIKTEWSEGGGIGGGGVVKKHTNICHFFLRNGRIEYLDDCTHDLAGKTVAMQPLPGKGDD